MALYTGFKGMPMSQACSPGYEMISHPDFEMISLLDFERISLPDFERISLSDFERISLSDFEMISLHNNRGFMEITKVPGRDLGEICTIIEVLWTILPYITK